MSAVATSLAVVVCITPAMHRGAGASPGLRQATAPTPQSGVVLYLASPHPPRGT